MEVINLLDNKVILAKSFLPVNECLDFIKKSEEIGFEEAKVNIDGNQTMFKAIRNNERVIFYDKNLAEKFWEKSQQIIPSPIGESIPYNLNEMFRIYKYHKGHRFKMHRDGSYIKNEFEYSLYTFMIYLNDDFEGGETIFKEGPIIKPQTGDLLIFFHPLKHEGKEVKSGQKYVLRSDIMYKLNQ